MTICSHISGSEQSCCWRVWHEKYFLRSLHFCQLLLCAYREKCTDIILYTTFGVKYSRPVFNSHRECSAVLLNMYPICGCTQYPISVLTLRGIFHARQKTPMMVFFCTWDRVMLWFWGIAECEYGMWPHILTPPQQQKNPTIPVKFFIVSFYHRLLKIVKKNIMRLFESALTMIRSQIRDRIPRMSRIRSRFRDFSLGNSGIRSNFGDLKRLLYSRKRSRFRDLI